MKRRDFLGWGAALGTQLGWPGALRAAPAAAHGAVRNARDENLLILIELKGGNDGLNTVIPYADPDYYSLRPRLAIARAQVLQLDERTGLHPALQGMVPMWQSGELAIVQGLGYAAPSFSHFRSIEIWDTGSGPDEFLRQGWLTRAFEQRSVPAGFTADGVVIGSAELGPLANGARTIALVNPEQFLTPARPAGTARLFASNPALEQVLSAQAAAMNAAERLRPHPGQYGFKTDFPSGAFGASVKTAMQLLAAVDTPGGVPLAGQGVAVIKLTLSGFDTHRNQLPQHANLLTQLSDGMVALRAALDELGRWQSSLIVTYAEFGRRPHENAAGGTDNGASAPHFVAGGQVQGGLYGAAPMLAHLDSAGNLPLGLDFRSLYATVLERWWGIESSKVLQRRFEPVPLLRA
jgi:uncharacterized protein (DUF1501 family)